MAQTANGAQRKTQTPSKSGAQDRGAHDALGAYEENWRVLFEATLDSLVLVDPVTRKGLLCNRNYATLCGFESVEDAERAITLNAFDFAHEDQRDAILETVVADAFDKDLRRIREFRTTTKGGNELWITTVATRIDYQGTPAALISVRDVTERKRAEAQLKAVQENYKTVFENSAVAITVTDSKERVIAWNKYAEGLLGMDRHDLYMKPVWSLYPKEEKKKIRALNVRRKGMQHRLETRMIKGDKDIIDVNISLSVVKGPDGEITGSIGIITDITESKRMDHALRASEERYRLLVENASQAIGVIQDGMIKFCNPKMAEAAGYSGEELTSKAFLEFIHPDDREMVLQRHARRQAGEDVPGSYSFRGIDEGGRVRWVSLNAARITWEGSPAVLVMLRDITEQVKMEEIVRAQRDLHMALSDAPTLDEGLRLCLDAAIRISDMDCGGIYLVDGRTGALDMAVHQGLPEALLGSASHLDADTARLVMRGQPVYSGHGKLGVSLAKAEKGGQLRATGVIPVSDENHVIGCLYVASHSLDEVPSMARDALEMIATHIGGAIARLRAEEALREAEEKWRSLVENSSGFILILDREGRIQFLNRSVPGLSAEHFVGRKACEFTAPENHKVIEKAIERVFKTGKPTRYETQGQGVNGDRSWYESQVVPIKRDKKVTAVLQISTDITDRKRAREALERQEEHFRSLIENAQDAIVILDGDGTVRYQSPSYERLLGRKPEERIGGHMLDLIHPDDAQTVVDHFSRVLRESGSAVRVEIRIRHADGSWRTVEVVGTNLLKNPAVAGIVVNFRDITDRKMAEDQKQRMEQQLLLSGRLAAVGELAAGVAHELNNPLAAVRGFAQLLASRDDLEESIREDLDTIYREAKRASKITTNLLSFARKHDPEMRMICLNEVIESCLELHAYRMRVNNIEVVTEFDPELPMTMADFHQLQQVCVNIITNAEQAMTEAGGAGRLTVKTEVAGEEVTMTFTDDGPGISEEDLGRLFDPFFTTKAVGKGTGLGLSICYGIVDQHGGRIRVESKPGAGTSFIIAIPIRSADQVTSEQDAPAHVEPGA